MNYELRTKNWFNNYELRTKNWFNNYELRTKNYELINKRKPM